MGHRGSRLRVDCWAAPSISTGHGVGGPATCGTPHPGTMRRLGHDGRGRRVGQTPASCPARARRRDHPGTAGALGQPRRRRRSCQEATAAAKKAAGYRAERRQCEGRHGPGSPTVPPRCSRDSGVPLAGSDGGDVHRRFLWHLGAVPAPGRQRSPGGGCDGEHGAASCTTAGSGQATGS